MATLNLLADPWIPSERGDQSPFDLLTRCRELHWRRADWNAATFQFLVGLVQTAVVADPQLCPDAASWELYTQAPPDRFPAVATRWLRAFEFYGARGFMQCDVPDNDGKHLGGVANLPDMPGANAIKKNSDIFRWREELDQEFTHAERAIALYTLSCSGWSAGGGFLANSRGGSPMTVMLLPERYQTLWQAIWLNVLPRDAWTRYFGDHEFVEARVFPWLDPHLAGAHTQKQKTSVVPNDLHPLNVYWQMPMRVRWVEAGLVREQGGLSYNGGGWRHPLSAYVQTKDGTYRCVRCDLGSGYKAWSPYLLGSEASLPAINVSEHIENGRDEARLWLFGWVISQAEALTWFDVKTPAVVSAWEGFAGAVDAALTDASQANANLENALRVAGVTKRVRNLLFLATEVDWFDHLAGLAAGEAEADWVRLLRRRARGIYDRHAAARPPMDYAKGLARLLR